MSLQESKAIDKIEILENKIIQVREANKILRDGIEISRELSRYTLVPGQDISSQPQEIQDICNLIWTPEVISAYQASLQNPGA